MKGYTDFMAGFFGPAAVATKPIGDMKYMDWNKVKQIVADHPNSVIYAGLLEDWNNTSGVIFARGKYYDGGVLYDHSVWATPAVDVDGEEIECYTTEKPADLTGGVPKWWGDGAEVLSDWDFDESIVAEY